MLNQATVIPERVFHALGDPTRAAMVEHLSRGPASVSKLAQPLPMSLSAVVQHLAVLEGSGLVSSRKVGRVRTCRIEPAALRGAEDWVAQRRALWEASLDRLGEFLAETDPSSEPQATDVRRVSKRSADDAQTYNRPAKPAIKTKSRSLPDDPTID